eukprot:COSAG04_NODE_5100_length_1738_cov_1.334960_1_plen_344_part_10
MTGLVVSIAALVFASVITSHDSPFLADCSNATVAAFEPAQIDVTAGASLGRCGGGTDAADMHDYVVAGAAQPDGGREPNEHFDRMPTAECAGQPVFQLRGTTSAPDGGSVLYRQPSNGSSFSLTGGSYRWCVGSAARAEDCGVGVADGGCHMRTSADGCCDSGPDGPGCEWEQYDGARWEPAVTTDFHRRQWTAFIVTAGATEASLSGYPESCSCSGTEAQVYRWLTVIAAVLLAAAGIIKAVDPDWQEEIQGAVFFLGITMSPYLAVCGYFWIACEAQDETQEGAFSVTLCILAILSCLYYYKGIRLAAELAAIERERFLSLQYQVGSRNPALRVVLAIGLVV